MSLKDILDGDLAFANAEGSSTMTARTTLTFSGTTKGATVSERNEGHDAVLAGFDVDIDLRVTIRLVDWTTPPSRKSTVTVDSVNYRVESFRDDDFGSGRELALRELGK